MPLANCSKDRDTDENFDLCDDMFTVNSQGKLLEIGLYFFILLVHSFYNSKLIRDR